MLEDSTASSARKNPRLGHPYQRVSGKATSIRPKTQSLLAKAITQNDAPNATIVTPIMVFAAIRRAVLPARRIDQRIRTLRKSETVDYTMAITVMTKQAATIRHAIRSAIKP